VFQHSANTTDCLNLDPTISNRQSACHRLDAVLPAQYLHCRNTEVFAMQVRVQKWGNSLAIRIPKPLAEDAKVEEGTVLNLAVSEGKVVATPVKKSKQSLKQMLTNVSRKNLHAEIESGAPVGREVW
jgi:antitoxin MazE